MVYCTNHHACTNAIHMRCRLVFTCVPHCIRYTCITSTRNVAVCMFIICVQTRGDHKTNLVEEMRLLHYLSTNFTTSNGKLVFKMSAGFVLLFTCESKRQIRFLKCYVAQAWDDFHRLSFQKRLSANNKKFLQLKLG